jgi:hypothetical protein
VTYAAAHRESAQHLLAALPSVPAATAPTKPLRHVLRDLAAHLLLSTAMTIGTRDFAQDIVHAGDEVRARRAARLRHPSAQKAPTR